MKVSHDYNALARKRRFVEFLTHSRLYLNDDDFLKPTTRTVHEDTNLTMKPSDSSKQSTLFVDKGTNKQRSSFVCTPSICERCRYAIVKAIRPNNYQFIVCATNNPAFPTTRKCTAFKLDEIAN